MTARKRQEVTRIESAYRARIAAEPSEFEQCRKAMLKELSDAETEMRQLRSASRDVRENLAPDLENMCRDLRVMAEYHRSLAGVARRSSN